MDKDEMKTYRNVLKYYAFEKEQIIELLGEGYDIYSIFSALTTRHYNMKRFYYLLERDNISLFDGNGCMAGEHGLENGGELMDILLKYFEGREDYLKCQAIKFVQERYNMKFRILYKA